MAARGDNSKARPAGTIDAEPFRRALTGCIRSVAGEGEIEVVFANERPGLAGDRIRLPEISKRPTAAELAVTRGLGDSMALRKACHDVLVELGQQDEPLLKIAMELERIALSDEYFIERKLYPNVDFYSGIIYRALGIPTSLFTVLFAVARTAGWVAQWKEMIEDPNMKIGRPRQLFIGSTPRKFVPVAKRK